MKIFKTLKNKRLLALSIAIIMVLSTVFSIPIIKKASNKTPQIESSEELTQKPIKLTENNTEELDETEKKETTDAINDLDEQITENPNDVKLYLSRAAQFSKLQKYDEAIADYTKAIELNPTAKTYYLRAMCYILKLEYEPAYSDLSIALEHEPENVDYLSSMADVCSSLKKYEENLSCLKTLLKTDNENAILYAMAGDSSVNLGDIDNALTYYENALKYYSNATSKAGVKKESLYAAKGNCLKSVSNYSDAVTAYTKSLELASITSLYFQRGFCYIQLGKYEDAIHDFSKAIDNGYEVAISKFQRGLCYYSTEEYEKALSDLSAYETAFPQKTDSFLYQGLCYQHLKKYGEAIQYLQKSIDAGTSVGDCNFNIGNCYYNQEDYKSSIPYYTKAIELNAQVYPAYLNRGIAYLKINKYNEAKVDLKKVIDECSNEKLVETAKKNYEPIKNITIITK